MNPAVDGLDAAMRLAIEQSNQVKGTTYPNPPVGAVILDADGAVVGVGGTEPAGGDHAEVLALRRAGQLAVGGTAVVTLEPCNHYGKTPPCVNALLDAKVGAVVYAVADPNPAAAGGAVRLTEAGVQVTAGVLADEVAGGPLREWLHKQRTGRPHVTWKYAASIDGRSAAADGTSQWITGEAARADVHRRRAGADAIVVGAGTVLADDPSLTVRLEDDTPFVPPLRVVLDPGLATIARGRVREGDAPTLYIHTADAKPPREIAAQRAVAPADGSNFDLRAVLELLAARGINEVQVEAGATLAGAFIAAGLADEILLYVAPVLLGDQARPLFAGLGIHSMSERAHLKIVDARAIGQDQRILLQPASAA